ncbi:MAG TPA: phosphoenolpyruvate--protein phosphotransferase [candidate division Zixibacteria bacterium]|nr:phosphoenolpyruvate--protein phosphotransferase [candidate division Zixibacteria bacterium]
MEREERTLTGVGVSEGIAIAPAFIIEHGEIAIEAENIDESQIDDEIERFRRAVTKSRDQLLRIQAGVAKTMGDASAAILEPQIMLMSDVAVVDETEAVIANNLLSAETAFDKVISRGIEALEAAENSLMAERSNDFMDVRRRVLANLMGMSHHIIRDVSDEHILVIQHLAPSETAQLFHNKFVGLALEMGGTTSHVAIMTRTMEIPCVLGVDGVTEAIDNGETVIIDGTNGKVVVSPSDETLAEYVNKKAAQLERKRNLAKFKGQKARTLDGKHISVAGNMELPGEAETVANYGAEGVGLFRTELLYTRTTNLPGEEEQAEIYSEVARSLAPNSIIIRTFDIGGDKFSEILGAPFEPNPFLGWRAIRIGLDRPRVLKTQLRAILRAAKDNNIKIMFPMISNIDEVIRAKELIEESKTELDSEGIPRAERIETGIMVEIPSAALMAREIAGEVDFFSIGTNDLVQYTLAVDRGNQRVSHLYQSFNPAVLRLIKATIDAAHLHGIWCGLCGEMAADPTATIMLIGMGIDELSMNPPTIPLIKGIIRAVDSRVAHSIAEECLRLTKHSQVVDFLNRKNRELLPPEFFDE